MHSSVIRGFVNNCSSVRYFIDRYEYKQFIDRYEYKQQIYLQIEVRDAGSKFDTSDQWRDRNS